MLSGRSSKAIPTNSPRSASRVCASMNVRTGASALVIASDCSSSPFRNGCSASSLTVCQTGAITNTVIRKAMPISTWFGGSAGTPIALRTSESTITMRVNEVIITRMAGANERNVSRISSCTPLVSVVDAPSSDSGPTPAPGSVAVPSASTQPLATASTASASPSASQ